MSCPKNLQGIGLSCADAMGGIKRVLIALADDIKSVTIANGIVTALELNDAKSFKEFAFRKQTGQYTSTVANDDAAGTSSVTTELTLQFSKADNVKRLAIQSLINANSVVIIETQMKDEDELHTQYVYLGVDNPVTCTTATQVSGTAAGDLNGFTITLQDLSRELPPFVDSAIVDQLVVA